jgi:hypothetical protein
MIILLLLLLLHTVEYFMDFLMSEPIILALKPALTSVTSKRRLGSALSIIASVMLQVLDVPTSITELSFAPRTAQVLPDMNVHFLMSHP